MSYTRTDLKAAVLLAAWILVLLGAGPALAHKVYLFAWVEGDQVMVDAYFSKSRKVVNGSIQVLDPEGRVLLEGKTDEQGAFSFPVPQKTDLRLVMDASMGHQTEFVIQADELPDVVSPGSSPPADAVSSTSEPQAGSTPEAASPVTPPPIATAPAKIDPGPVRDIVEAALDKKLEPIDQSLRNLQRSVARLREEKGPGLTEIIGGLGWIMGLCGIALYFHGRSKARHGD